jgi:signal transduction histidine kinase
VEIADAIREHDVETLRAGEPRQWEEIAPHDDGPHTYLSVKFALPDASGAVYALGTFSADITERKQAEEERTRLVEQLREAVRARDEFLAVASHELKTPLTPLKLQVQSLRRQLEHANVSGQRPNRVDQALASLERQATRLTSLVDNLLDMSRMTRGQLHLTLDDVNLSEVVSEVVERFRSEIAAARCTIELCLGADLVGRWDRTRVEQLFTNLLTNALKYASGKPIKVVTERRAGAARLIVQDWGMGIAPEHRDRIFEPFERAVSYRNISGFGLGLYIVRQIVDAHRGHIHLESQVGRGSIFIVDLPLRTGASDKRSEGAEVVTAA